MLPCRTERSDVGDSSSGPAVVSAEYCRLPAIVPVKWPGTHRRTSIGGMHGVVPVAAIVPVLPSTAHIPALYFRGTSTAAS